MRRYTKEDLDTMTRTLYGEARGEGVAGLQAVANVIKNRLKIGRGGKTIKEVCLAPYQFSCWNVNDSQKRIIENLDKEDVLYQCCESIAKQVLDGDLEDNTNGATSYHAKSVNPYWADKTKITAVIGNHIFYKGV